MSAQAADPRRSWADPLFACGIWVVLLALPVPAGFAGWLIAHYVG